MDEQQTGRRAGVPAASSRRPPAARSMPSMQAKTRSSAARRSSPDAAQRSPVVGPPSLLARRGVAECRKGFKRAGWPCRAAVPSSAARTSSCCRHQLMLKQRQHGSQRVGRRHQLMLKRRRHDHHRPTDRWMEDGPRGGRRQRPSSAQRQRQAGSSSSPGRKTGITAGQLDGSGDNWPTINQRQPSRRAPRLSSSAHQPCAGSVDAPQPVALRRCCVKEADRPPRPWTSKTGRHHH